MCTSIVAPAGAEEGTSRRAGGGVVVGFGDGVGVNAGVLVGIGKEVLGLSFFGPGQGCRKPDNCHKQNDNRCKPILELHNKEIIHRRHKESNSKQGRSLNSPTLRSK